MPGFLLILLGGINGPFHSAMVSVMAKRERQDSAQLLAAINTLVGLGLLVVTVLLVLLANPLITLVGPGLDPELHALAVLQLRLMAPMALLAGLIGLGFGALNAADVYWLPAISPLLSSLAVLIGLALLWLQAGAAIGTATWAWAGAAVLAISTLAGALLQWLVQLPALAKQGLGQLRLNFRWRQAGVREVLQVMWPATLSSGMLQINVYTDLFFASGIAGAAAGLGYAGLLVQTPLGILSNMLLVPLLPVFARLSAPEQRTELIARIRQGVMLSNASMLPLGALMVALAAPIVALVYERGSFDAAAAQLVVGILMAYGLGMPAYLARDVLVRVFYALGDGQTPFRISVAGIGLNVGFDWLLVGRTQPQRTDGAGPQRRRPWPGAGHGGRQCDHVPGAAAGAATQAGAATAADLGPRQPAAHPRRGGCRRDRLGDGAMDSVAERSAGLGFAGGALRWGGGWALRTARQQFWGSRSPPTQPSAVSEAARS